MHSIGLYSSGSVQFLLISGLQLNLQFRYHLSIQFIPYSDRHFYQFNIRLFVNNILSVQTVNINVLLTDGKQNSWLFTWLICVKILSSNNPLIKRIWRNLYNSFHFSVCRAYISIYCRWNIQDKLIPYSDRHFYCVNLNKCHYWEQYFI